MSKKNVQPLISRRQFLRLGTLAGGGLILAACSPQTGNGNSGGEVETNTPLPRTPVPPEAEARVMTKDVIDFVLESDEWEGQYGSVTFKLQEGRYEGKPIYFIRTDASDATFAETVGLVHVPLLAQGRDVAKPLYLFDDDRLPVFSTAPSQEDFVSLYEVKQVSVSEDGLSLETAVDIETAIADGRASVSEHAGFVNYPIVKWEGGELATDTEKKETLGKGQLMTPVDTENMSVTFKLHQCFPGSRYILTDTSSVGMAPMMSIPASAPTQALMDSGATDEIWIFVNGIPGSGVMGFQPAIFDNEAGQPAWSPFWNHKALKWVDESQARVLRSSAEIRELVGSGELEEFNGVPNSHPNGFVVNCPAPILAPNNFTA